MTMRWSSSLALLLLASHAAAQELYQHPETNFVFSAVIEAFARAHIERYSDSRLGVKVEYVATGLGKADFYLFDNGIPDIADGITSQAVREAFLSADAEVEKMA
ncbi:MAG: hypothetical protein U1F45_18905 [Burkholderiales bacterium]